MASMEEGLAMDDIPGMRIKPYFFLKESPFHSFLAVGELLVREVAQ